MDTRHHTRKHCQTNTYRQFYKLFTRFPLVTEKTAIL